jgi:2-iminobutanoate/2-iminopropanoate deaminase
MNRLLSPSSIRAPLARYTHGVVVPPGTELLYTSGQLGIAPDGTVPADIEAQTVLCFENIKAILAEGGMSFADVVRFNGFVTDRALFPIYGAVRERYIPGGAFASTLVIVAGLARPEFKIEVEATAARAVS